MLSKDPKSTSTVVAVLIIAGRYPAASSLCENEDGGQGRGEGTVSFRLQILRAGRLTQKADISSGERLPCVMQKSQRVLAVEGEERKKGGGGPTKIALTRMPCCSEGSLGAASLRPGESPKIRAISGTREGAMGEVEERKERGKERVNVGRSFELSSSFRMKTQFTSERKSCRNLDSEQRQS